MNQFFKIFHKDYSILSLFILIASFVFSSCVTYGQQNPFMVYVEPVFDLSGISETTEKAAMDSLTAAQEALANQHKFIVVIDPGHGGNDSGVMYHSHTESKVNFRLAKYLKKYLEEFDGVEVFLTRTTDKYMELKERSDFAIKHKADLLVSLHNNSMQDAGGYASGCSVCVAMGNYKKEIGMASQKLGANIAYELSQIGINNNGLVMRSSQDTDYDNGRAADYYAIIRNSLLADIPAVIVEHGFLDNPDDYYDFLSTKEQLEEVGKADAIGIARYLSLVKSDTKKPLPPLADYKVKVCHMRRHKAAKRYLKVYYPTKEQQLIYELE